MRKLAVLMVAAAMLLCACSVRQTAAPAPVTAAPTVQPAAPRVAAVRATPEATAEPTETPALKLGDEGDAVRAMQGRLIALNYLRIDAPTGWFGQKTAQALRDFQSENALENDGVLGKRSEEALFSNAAKPAALPLLGYVIGIDPGHQNKENNDLEPVAPGSDEQKKKVSSGTQGRFTHVPEHEVVLEVGLLLSGLLGQAGADVVMTRQTGDVDISNAERAQLFNEKKTDYALRLHLNGSDDPDVSGAFVLVPHDNPFQADCARAAQILLKNYLAETKLADLGITERHDQTGFNWCERMIVNIEMGHMTNEEEDHKLVRADFQRSMAEGLYKGILEYFE